MIADRKTFFVFLVIVASGIWTYNLSLFFTGPYEKKRSSINHKTILWKTRENFNYKADFRDPFFCSAFMVQKPVIKKVTGTSKKTKAKPKKKIVKLPECAIGGIVYNEINPMALFVYNGKSTLVKQGDIIDSILIQRISRDTVSVVYKKKIFFLLN